MSTAKEGSIDLKSDIWIGNKKIPSGRYKRYKIYFTPKRNVAFLTGEECEPLAVNLQNTSILVRYNHQHTLRRGGYYRPDFDNKGAIRGDSENFHDHYLLSLNRRFEASKSQDHLFKPLGDSKPSVDLIKPNHPMKIDIISGDRIRELIRQFPYKDPAGPPAFGPEAIRCGVVAHDLNKVTIFWEDSSGYIQRKTNSLTEVQKIHQQRSCS